jgi:spore coat polysaccharide biosynthesis protein SpsF (cytidylyltransferase family)
VGAPACPEAFARPDLVLDVNTAEEYRYIAALYEHIYPRKPQFGILDVIDWHDKVWTPMASTP